MRNSRWPRISLLGTRALKVLRHKIEVTCLENFLKFSVYYHDIYIQLQFSFSHENTIKILFHLRIIETSNLWTGLIDIHVFSLIHIFFNFILNTYEKWQFCCVLMCINEKYQTIIQKIQSRYARKQNSLTVHCQSLYIGVYRLYQLNTPGES